VNQKGRERKRSLANLRDLLGWTEENREKVSIIGVPAEIRKGASKMRKGSASYSVFFVYLLVLLIKLLREEG
jgi:hypothetical protein